MTSISTSLLSVLSCGCQPELYNNCVCTMQLQVINTTTTQPEGATLSQTTTVVDRMKYKKRRNTNAGEVMTYKVDSNI